MSEVRLKSVSDYYTPYDSVLFGGTLLDVMNHLSDLLEQIPPAHRGGARIDINVSRDGDDEYIPHIQITYDKEMTPAEIALDDANKAAHAKAQRQADIATFKRIQQTHPDWRDF